MSKCGNFGLCENNSTANSTLLTLGKSGFSTSGGLSGDDSLGVSVDLFLNDYRSVLYVQSIALSNRKLVTRESALIRIKACIGINESTSVLENSAAYRCEGVCIKDYSVKLTIIELKASIPLCGCKHRFSTFTCFKGRVYRVDITTLNCSEATVKSYESITDTNYGVANIHLVDVIRI